MNGKFNVFHYLNQHKNEKILVIADGTIFGSEIDRGLQLINERKDIDLYDKLGYSYFDKTLDDLDDELNTFRQLKKKEAAV